jgi:hypothetical protein
MSDDSRMEDLEQRIFELAHRIWEEEERPHGQADRHWEMARLLFTLDMVGSPSAQNVARRGADVCAIAVKTIHLEDE